MRYICISMPCRGQCLLIEAHREAPWKSKTCYQWWIPARRPTLTTVQAPSSSPAICPLQPCSQALGEWVAAVCKRRCQYVTRTNLHPRGILPGVQPEYHTAEKTISAANTPTQMRNVLIFAAVLWPHPWQWWRKCQLFPRLNATLCLRLFLFIDLASAPQSITSAKESLVWSLSKLSAMQDFTLYFLCPISYPIVSFVQGQNAIVVTDSFRGVLY